MSVHPAEVLAVLAGAVAVVLAVRDAPGLDDLAAKMSDRRRHEMSDEMKQNESSAGTSGAGITTTRKTWPDFNNDGTADYRQPWLYRLGLRLVVREVRKRPHTVAARLLAHLEQAARELGEALGVGCPR